MKKRLVIFGIAEQAQLAHYFFSTDSAYDVVAFTVDSTFITASKFCGLPVLPFEEIDKHYPPDEHELFIALGYSKINQLRKDKYVAANALGMITQ